MQGLCEGLRTNHTNGVYLNRADNLVQEVDKIKSDKNALGTVINPMKEAQIPVREKNGERAF